MTTSALPRCWTAVERRVAVAVSAAVAVAVRRSPPRRVPPPWPVPSPLRSTAAIRRASCRTLTTRESTTWGPARRSGRAQALVEQVEHVEVDDRLGGALGGAAADLGRLPPGPHRRGGRRRDPRVHREQPVLLVGEAVV